MDPTHGLDVLSALPRVPRFDMTAMSVPSRERAELGLLWGPAVEAALAAAGAEGGAAAVEEAERLRKKFRL